jgi:hypothetical protein
MDRELDKPQDDFARDLNPEPLAGRNHGNEGPGTTQGEPASEDKELVNKLQSFTHDELAQIPVVEQGMRLEQGKSYIDLNALDKGEFKAYGKDTAGADNRYVAKDAVDYETWNRLLGREERVQ